MKSYDYESADFYDKEMPKAGTNYPCLEVVLIDFVLVTIIICKCF